MKSSGASYNCIALFCGLNYFEVFDMQNEIIFISLLTVIYNHDANVEHRFNIRNKLTVLICFTLFLNSQC